MLAGQLPQTVAEHSHSEINRLTVLNRDILDPAAVRSGRAADRAGRQPAVQRRGSGAAAPARRVPVDPHRHGDGAGRGRRAARRRARRQGLRRAQRQGPVLRQGARATAWCRRRCSGPSRGCTPDWSASTGTRPRRGRPTTGFRQQVFKLIDIAFAQRRKTSRNAFASGRARATSRRAGCWPPASTRRAEARRSSIADFVRLLQRSGVWDPQTKRLIQPARDALAPALPQRTGRAARRTPSTSHNGCPGSSPAPCPAPSRSAVAARRSCARSSARAG